MLFYARSLLMIVFDNAAATAAAAQMTASLFEPAVAGALKEPRHTLWPESIVEATPPPMAPAGSDTCCCF